jgi:hypothetical protein
VGRSPVNKPSKKSTPCLRPFAEAIGDVGSEVEDRGSVFGYVAL